MKKSKRLILLISIGILLNIGPGCWEAQDYIIGWDNVHIQNIDIAGNSQFNLEEIQYKNFELAVSLSSGIISSSPHANKSNVLSAIDPYEGLETQSINISKIEIFRINEELPLMEINYTDSFNYRFSSDNREYLMVEIIDSVNKHVGVTYEYSEDLSLRAKLKNLPVDSADYKFKINVLLETEEILTARTELINLYHL